MKHSTSSSLRKILITATTTAAAFAVTVGLPAKKSIAAEPGSNGASPTAAHGQPGGAHGSSSGVGVGIGINLNSLFGHPSPRREVVQLVQVNPTAVRLIKLANQALDDPSLAERIFREPDKVASEYNLSEIETKVLRQMTSEQFATARQDAARVAAARLAEANEKGHPTLEEINVISGRMVVGRAILAAVGRSYLDAADAHDCCPWNKAIQIGVNSDPVAYASVFAR